MGFCLRCGRELEEGDLEEGICLVCGEPIATVQPSEEESEEEAPELATPPPEKVEWIREGEFAVCPLCQAAYRLEALPSQCERCSEEADYANTVWILPAVSMYLEHQQSGETIALEDGLILGRTSISCLAEDRYVSRTHASVRVEADGVFIADEHSQNGTWINDQKLVPGEYHHLQPGDTLRLDEQQFNVILP